MRIKGIKPGGVREVSWLRLEHKRNSFPLLSLTIHANGIQEDYFLSYKSSKKITKKRLDGFIDLVYKELKEKGFFDFDIELDDRKV